MAPAWWPGAAPSVGGEAGSWVVCAVAIVRPSLCFGDVVATGPGAGRGRPPGRKRPSRTSTSASKKRLMLASVSTSAGGPDSTARPWDRTSRRSEYWAAKRQVVDGAQDAEALLPAKFVSELEHELAVAKVERGRGLVHDQHGRLLHEGTGEHDPLATRRRKAPRAGVGRRRRAGAVRAPRRRPAGRGLSRRPGRSGAPSGPRARSR